MELRPYQQDNAAKASDLLKRYKIAYLAFDMRTGKTLTALEACRLSGYHNVLFVTKKKAIGSVQKDYSNFGYTYNLMVTNYDQLHNVSPSGWDCVVADEAHSLKAYPKPSGRTKLLREIIHTSKSAVLFLSGTPTPESYSELYHQYWVSPYSPFPQANFYKWAKEYVTVRQRMIQGRLTNDYSLANEQLIKSVVSKYTLTFTREQADFSVAQVNESVIEIECDSRVELLMQRLIRDRYFMFRDGDVLTADTAVILQNKLHQISSGTVITDSGISKILDDSKAKYIAEHYGDKKIAIFYKFKAEGDVLKRYFPEATDIPERFATTRVFLSQVQSGSMGVDLSDAQVLIYYNIDFSAVQYWQSRDRLLKYDREASAEVHYIFNRVGIEGKVLKAVRNKESYTQSWFKRDYLKSERRVA